MKIKIEIVGNELKVDKEYGVCTRHDIANVICTLSLIQDELKERYKFTLLNESE